MTTATAETGRDLIRQAARTLGARTAFPHLPRAPGALSPAQRRVQAIRSALVRCATADDVADVYGLLMGVIRGELPGAAGDCGQAAPVSVKDRLEAARLWLQWLAGRPVSIERLEDRAAAAAAGQAPGRTFALEPIVGASSSSAGEAAAVAQIVLGVRLGVQAAGGPAEPRPAVVEVSAAPDTGEAPPRVLPGGGGGSGGRPAEPPGAGAAAGGLTSDRPDGG